MTVGQTPIPGLFVISGHKVNVGGKKAFSPRNKIIVFFHTLYKPIKTKSEPLL